MPEPTATSPVQSIYGTYKLKSIEMPNVRILEEHHHELVIEPRGLEFHIIRKVEVCDAEDGTGAWTEEYQNWRFATRRHNIAAINLFFLPKQKYWSLQIEVKGAEQGISIYYEKSSHAKPLYNVLKEYHLSTAV